VILQTLGGKDKETRSEIGFLTLMTKIECSDSLRKWNYVVKNLIILDRCVEEKYYLNDIGHLDLPHISSYKDENHMNSTIF